MVNATMEPKEVLELRTSLGLTQGEMAERVGVNRTSVTHWENGRHAPSGPALRLLAMLREQARERSRKKKL